MHYAHMLKTAAETYRSIVCMGMDPDLQKIPLIKGTVRKRMTKFYKDIWDAAVCSDTLPAATKPNLGWWWQYGDEGLLALKDVMRYIKKLKVDAEIPIILDFKTGDIGTSSSAYARIAFEQFPNADAVVVHPYMGSDSAGPYIKWAEDAGKGIYVLTLTSNPGGKDLQKLEVKYKNKTVPLFEAVADLVLEWGKNASENVGYVLGATSPDELELIAAIIAEKDLNKPVLIPGVGKQGGSAGDVTARILKSGLNPKLVRINSSGGINYAYEKYGGSDWAACAVKEIETLDKEIAAAGLKL